MLITAPDHVTIVTEMLRHSWITRAIERTTLSIVYWRDSCFVSISFNSFMCWFRIGAHFLPNQFVWLVLLSSCFCLSGFCFFFSLFLSFFLFFFLMSMNWTVHYYYWIYWIFWWCLLKRARCGFEVVDLWLGWAGIKTTPKHQLRNHDFIRGASIEALPRDIAAPGVSGHGQPLRH